MQRLKAEEHAHLSGSVLKTLAQNRITTILAFLQEDPGKLSTLTKLSLPQVLDIRNAILNKYAAPLIKLGSLKLDTLDRRKCLNTGILSLDTATGGGIPIGYITELCGLANSGKTQLCLQLAINSVKNSESSVLYIDTKGDFSAVRVQKILDACGYSHKEMALIMIKIKIVHVWTMEELLDFLKKLKNQTINIENFVLVIIDSLPSLMFQYLGDDNKVGLSFLNTFVNYARYLGKHFNLAFICVNIQTRWVDQENADLEDDGEQATSYMKETHYKEKRNRCLGKYWHTIPMMVMYIDKQERNSNDGSSSHICLNITVIIYNSLINNSQLSDRSSNGCNVMLNNLGIT
ncbi:DNA repair protein RAD51 homolog 4 [Cydia amplana]|uniref:DNA repair protein RAD51 homolog 4 n=1 Tax=Cydia amplana TaxID=1869771 RepID=UPI002FE605DC